MREKNNVWRKVYISQVVSICSNETDVSMVNVGKGKYVLYSESFFNFNTYKTGRENAFNMKEKDITNIAAE